MGLPVLDESQVETIANIIGDTNDGLSGSEHAAQRCRAGSPAFHRQSGERLCPALRKSGRSQLGGFLSC